MIVYHRERRRDHGPYCLLSREGARSRPDLTEPGEDRPGTPAGSGGSPACSDGATLTTTAEILGLSRDRVVFLRQNSVDRRRDGRKKRAGAADATSS